MQIFTRSLDWEAQKCVPQVCICIVCYSFEKSRFTVDLYGDVELTFNRVGHKVLK